MEDEAKWPAVDAAFTFVVPSYQWMLTRIESADSRLHAMQVFVLTITTAFPPLARGLSESINFKSWLLGLALVAAASGLAVGFIARSGTHVMLVDPKMLYSGKWLKTSSWTFKKDMLFFAGQDFEKNRLRIVTKHNALKLMTIIFVVELLLLGSWFWRNGV